MKFSYVPASVWFGTDESHQVLLDALEQIDKLTLAGETAMKAAIQLRGGGFGGDPFGLPPMWEMSGSTAVINVRGSLIPGQAGFLRLFGVTGYDDIKQAMMEATSQKDKPKAILMNIDSGGGAVTGVDDMGRFIRMVAKETPVISYTAGTMGSAAYWTGASADSIFASQTAQVGSVGTLIISAERSKQLAADGVTVNVTRFGKFKALANSFEPLSKEGQAQLQAIADESGRVFVEYAAERRGVTPEAFQKTMGEGRVFVGRQAHEVGLVDGVMSFDDVLAHAKTLDKTPRTVENPRQSAKDKVMKVRAISKAVVLAILGGTAVSALGLATEAANVTGEKPEAEDVTALTAEATEVAAAFDTSVKTASEAAVKAAVEPLNKTVADLTAKVTLLEAGASDLTAKITAANEMCASYSGVIKASISVMAVALQAADTGATLQGPALLAEHDRLKELYVKKFPAGGVAAVTPATEDPNKPKAAVPSADFLAATGAWNK